MCWPMQGPGSGFLTIPGCSSMRCGISGLVTGWSIAAGSGSRSKNMGLLWLSPIQQPGVCQLVLFAGAVHLQATGAKQQAGMHSQLLPCMSVVPDAGQQVQPCRARTAQAPTCVHQLQQASYMGRCCSPAGCCCSLGPDATACTVLRVSRVLGAFCAGTFWGMDTPDEAPEHGASYMDP